MWNRSKVNIKVFSCRPYKLQREIDDYFSGKDITVNHIAITHHDYSDFVVAMIEYSEKIVR